MMGSADDEMTEASSPPPPPPESSSGDGDTAVNRLLPYARQLIDQGKPSHALQVVVMALKNIGGDEAVLNTLNRARQQYVTKLQTASAADELASLFAECAIAEALPSGNQPMSPHRGHHTAEPSVESDSNGVSILAETGRRQIVLDAFSDGSSFVCLQCGGLVSNLRRDEHYAYWCCNN